MNALTIYIASLIYAPDYAGGVPQAAYTAVVDTGRSHFTFGNQHDYEDATAAAVAGLAEAVAFLRHPARINLVNDNPLVGEGCLGTQRRQLAHEEEWRRLDEALARGGHQIVASSTARGDTTIKRCRETADEIARWPERARNLLTQLRESLNASRPDAGASASGPAGDAPTGDGVTPKQLNFIRTLARERGLDAEDECLKVMRVPLDQLTKRQASSFIDDLKGR